ncbi:MAG: glycosyl hydrolase [Bacteroidota bacterium]
MRANFAYNRYGVDDIREGAKAIDEKDVIEISMKPDGEVNWNSKKGQWTIIRFGYTSMGTQNRSAPDTGVGLECDKYNASAFEFHFNKMMENLLPFLEPLGKNGKVGLLIDSYEVGMQNWTPGFEKIFKDKNKYSIIKHLPALTGRVVENADTTNRFLWDLRRTQGNLMGDNYYGKFTELCHKHNIISYIQPYDRGPMEEMQIGSRIDTNVGEFWNNLSSIFQNNWTMRRTVKLSAAIAHTNGQKIVAAESFTGEPESSKWQEYPFGLKLLGDRMFAQGLNRMIFHRFAHQPHPTAKPGMTMGPWGSHFDRTNTWWDHGAKEWITYLSRCQYMLQQGNFVADLVYFTGEDAGVYTRVERNELKPSPPDGYDYDLINSEVLLNRAKVVDKRLVLPDGISYQVLILQDFKTMSLKVLSKISEFVGAGLVVMGERPLRTPGLTNDQKKFTKLVDELWNLKKIISGKSVQGVLNEIGLDKDFDWEKNGGAPIAYIHRKTADADIYFIANQRRLPADVVCRFRISNKQPETWDPVTGKFSKLDFFQAAKDLTTISIGLHELQSRFIVFRDTLPVNHTNKINSSIASWSNTTERELPKEVNTFKMPSIRVKPENSIMLSINGFMDGQLPWTDFYCIYPSPGEKLYGGGHSTLGLTVGRNGIAVWENANGKPEFNFSVEKAISGWIHIQLVCDDGVPSIYADGKLIKSGIKSKYIVHPAPRIAYLDEGASFFNGDLGRTESVQEGHDQEILLQDWEVSFPPNSGAPATIHLTELASLHTHPEKGVKYFSGTCTYKKTVNGLKKGSRYVIDLGDVEVIAEVIVNGTSLGVMWTHPFVADITEAVADDDNNIEVRVTNLWVNRLIGDEQEPEVYKYTPGGGGSGFKSLSGGAIEELPGWYKKGEPKPNDGRVAFATWKHYNKDSPLMLSGMIGPVMLFQLKK